MSLLAHAAGIRNLPGPKQKPLLLYNVDKSPIPTDGPFASIVKAYCEEQAKKTEMREKPKLMLQELHDSNVQLIGDVVESSLKRTGHKVNTDVIQAELKATYEGLDMTKKEDRKIKDISLLDIDLQPPKRNEEMWLSNTQMSSKEVERLATLDTGRIEKKVHSETYDTSDEVNLPQVNNKEKFHTTAEQEKFYNSIRYEKQEKGTEAYVYTEGEGYHFPYGQEADIAEKVAVKKLQLDGKSRMYRKGNSFYDEDGEFLYKLP